MQEQLPSASIGKDALPIVSTSYVTGFYYYGSEALASPDPREAKASLPR